MSLNWFNYECMIDQLLNILLFFVHLVLILFNLLGWIWRKTRKWHFWTVMLTLFSWIVPGIWFGFGYCFLTDWHWQIKRQLGESNLPNSFIQYVFEALGINIAPRTTDLITLICFIASLLIALYFRFFHKKAPKSNL